MVEFRRDCPDCGGPPLPAGLDITDTTTSGFEPVEPEDGALLEDRAPRAETRLALRRFEQERAWERERQEEFQTWLNRCATAVFWILLLWGASQCGE